MNVYRTPLSSIFVALCMGLSFPNVCSAAYPDRPIRLVVPAPPGGGFDTVARQVAEMLSQRLGQPVVVDNKPGGNTVIATEAVARAVPDGYTLLLTGSPHTINPVLLKKMPYDAVKDFSAVAKVGEAPFFLVSSANTGVKSLGEFRAYAASKPANLTFAVSDPTTRMASETFFSATQIKNALLVTYKGTAPAMSDVAAGHVGFFMVASTATLPFRGTDRVRFVGAATEKRVAGFMEVPTFAEQGVNVKMEIWYGVLAPAKTPSAVLDTLSEAIAHGLGDAQFMAKLRNQGIEPAGLTRRQFENFLHQDLERSRTWAKDTNVQPE